MSGYYTFFATLILIIFLVAGYASGNADKSHEMAITKGESLPTLSPVESLPMGTYHISAQSPPKSITGTLTSDPDFHVFMQMLNTTDLYSAIKETEILTVFAPTNEAFERLDNGSMELLKENKDTLTDLIDHHLIKGNITIQGIKKDQYIKTLEGNDVLNSTYIDAMMVGSQIQCTNGIVYKIYRILIPVDMKDMVKEREIPLQNPENLSPSYEAGNSAPKRMCQGAEQC